MGHETRQWGNQLAAAPNESSNFCRILVKSINTHPQSAALMMIATPSDREV